MPAIRSRIATLLVALVLGACQTAFASDAATVREMSIAEARASQEGTVVIVTGTVTVPSGAFASSLSTGFAIQDETAGIYVLDAAHDFALGERLRVTGRRGVEFDQVNLHLESVEKLPGPGRVEARPVRTGRVGAAEEGFLIRAEGRIERVEDDAPYGYKLFIDDGSGALQVFIDASTELIEDVSRWKPADKIHVTGFAGRYETVREIMPRVLSDMNKQTTE